MTSAKKAVSVHLIGSLNVTAPGAWLGHGRRIQEAGADALELNIYFLVTDVDTTSRMGEARYAELVAAGRGEISIPLSVKVSPYFPAFPNLASRLVPAGAEGLTFVSSFCPP